MGRTWTNDQAISLAPDAAALKTAQGLASPRKWTTLGSDGDFIWGLAQGSGALPYQVQIDLAEPAFKCSCPSRKFPCKHGLGLLLLFANQASAVTAAARPDWVNEWAAKRAEKVAKQESKAAAGAAAPPTQDATGPSEMAPNASPAAAPPATDAVAQLRRREKRAANIAQGLAFLDGWQRDLARQGLAAVAPAGYGFWDGAARRLIDAQAPGLARRVRALGTAIGGVADSEERAVAELGRLHLLVTAARRRADLTPAWQEEIDAQLGLTVDQDELRQRTGVRASWFVGAQTVREEDKIITRTSYLFSNDGQVAQLLEFSPASHPSVASIALGRWFDGELVYYPGVDNRRALWKTPPQDSAGGVLPVLETCNDLLSAHAAALAANPFCDALPALVSLTPARQADRGWLQDATGAALPLAASFGLVWELIACAGGQPLEVVGLWDGFAFTPLTAFADGGLLQLASRNA